MYTLAMSYKPIPAFSYDFLTPAYDVLLNLMGFGDGQRSKIVDLLNLKQSERLLDVGCGTGSLLKVAKRKFPTVSMVGIDIDQKVLNIAGNKFQKEGLDIDLIKTGAEKLPFKTASFDAIVSTLIFHHLPYEIKRQALKEIHRVLKPNGRFLLVDFGKLKLPLKLVYYLEVLIKIPEAKTAKDNVEGKIPGLLKETGFKFKEVAPRYFGIQYLLSRK